MRVNVYAEEMTPRVEIVEKRGEDGKVYTGVRFWLELPVTTNPLGVQKEGEQPVNVQGPFLHRRGDDDTSAVTFWGKRELRVALVRAINLLDEHHTRKHDLGVDTGVEPLYYGH